MAVVLAFLARMDGWAVDGPGIQPADGRRLATASDDNTVLLWDVIDRGRLRRLGKPLTGQISEVFAVVFAPDGHTQRSCAVTSSCGRSR
jgi:WD40 repeat protein